MNQATQVTVKNGEKTRPNKDSIYREFILWTAMPFQEKAKLGIETQEQFIDYYGIGPNTPSRWKQRGDFENRVDAILKMWSTDKTPDVVHAIYRTAVKGNPLSQMLWLQYFKKFNPKAPPEEDEKKVVLSPGDIRYAIEQLPEQLKEKHYGYLRELAEDISAVRDARDITEDNWTERPPESIPDEADNDAQDVSYAERSNDMAKSNSRCLCANMEWEIPQSDNQSTAWRW